MLNMLKPKFTLMLCTVTALLCAGLNARAENALTALDTSTGKNDSQIVKLTFSEPLESLPMHFATANPHRIVLDFPRTDNQMAERAVGALNVGVLGTYRVVKANDRTRVVFNLAGPGDRKSVV